MQEELIYIQHMNTPRDVLLVRSALENLGLQVQEIELGTAAFFNPEAIPYQALEEVLKGLGFLLLPKKDKLFLEQVKGFVEEYLDKVSMRLDLPLLSVFLEKQTGMVYGTMSKRFRKIENRTIENYFIQLKADKVKSLLHTTNLTLEEISLQLNYRNPRSLARMFKIKTGLSIRKFKKGDRPGYLMAF